MKLLALMKKEFFRFFRDPRLIVTMILPGILIYIVYSIIGSAITDRQERYDFTVYVSGESAAVSLIEASVLANEGWTVELIGLPSEGIETPDDARAAVADGQATALIVFPERFDEIALGGAAAEIAAVEIAYDSSETASTVFASIAGGVLDAYGRTFQVATNDLSPEGNPVMQMMARMLPFLIVVFVFSSCMSVTLESVAGEKERGTLATVLVTSAKRTDVALGKVLPLVCISLIGAVSSFLGVALSLPAMMGLSLGDFIVGFGFESYLLLFLLIFSVVPLIVGAIAAVSTYARSVKEASGYTSVIMILAMVLSVVTAFTDGIGAWVVAVPILNAVTAMQGILTATLSVWQCITAFALNLVYTALLILLIARMLSSERIMFGK